MRNVKLPKSEIEKLHHDILTTLRQSFPGNGFNIVAITKSSTTESLYTYIIYKRRLYYFRFSAHTNEAKGHQYRTFNLLDYSRWAELRDQLHRIFLEQSKKNNYQILGYYNFLWLALCYRIFTNPSFSVQFNPDDDVRQVNIFMDGNEYAKIDNSKSIRTLLANINFGFITPINAHIQQVYLKKPVWLRITPAGEKILRFYPKASHYSTNRIWLMDPISASIEVIARQLNIHESDYH